MLLITSSASVLKATIHATLKDFCEKQEIRSASLGQKHSVYLVKQWHLAKERGSKLVASLRKHAALKKAPGHRSQAPTP